MSWITIVALALVGGFLLLILSRLLGRGAVQSLDAAAFAARLQQGSDYRGLRTPTDESYHEVLHFAEVELETGESVLAACGSRGETETVLMATNRRVLLFTRRFASGKYHVETFDYHVLRPIPISSSVIGGAIRLLEGSRIAEMKSPGAESWMDTAEDTIRLINKQIMAARTAKSE
jgi:hypothetical protein